MKSELNRILDEIFTDAMAGKGTAASYALRIGGEQVASGIFGHLGGGRGGELTEDCTFNIASISKMFVTVSVMQLCEQGKMALDDPLVKYLPRLWMPDERYKDITIRQCLNHSSGLPGTLWRNFSVSNMEQTTDYYELVYEYLSKNRLKADPGVYSTYCNDGFTMAEMAVVSASGMSYPEYLRKNIFEPLELRTTRSAFAVNPDCQIVSKDDRPYELLPASGAYGLTSNMTDLAKFGDIFLFENDILSEESKTEMAKCQGKTFLESDTASQYFGLGWDTVKTNVPDYDIGEKAPGKSGGSMQMNSQLIILPKYDVSFAVSATHDSPLSGCEVDTAMMMIATAMLERGVNITFNWQDIPQELRSMGGMYTTAGELRKLVFEGPFAVLKLHTSKGEWLPEFPAFHYDGKVLENADGQQLSFEHHEDDDYLLLKTRVLNAPYAMKLRDRKPMSPAWAERAGKLYLPVVFDVCDETVVERCESITFEKLSGFEGLMVLRAVVSRKDAWGNSYVERAFEEVDENTGCSVVTTPFASRDWTMPTFFEKDGKKYVDACSYRLRLAEGLPAYDGQPFSDDMTEAELYEITKPVQTEPEVPEGRRMIISNEKGVIVWDSIMTTKFSPVSSGWVIMR